jgi:hypothetical protein
MDIPRELLDTERRSARLARFDAGIDAILRDALGKNWLLAKSEDQQHHLTQRQRDWRELRYFYEASIVNSGDLFGYLQMIYARPEMFEQIEAIKTLAAAEALRPLYDVYSQLPTEDEKNDYRHETNEQRQPIEGSAEDMFEFADLLIRFAERHPAEFPEVEAQDPFDRSSELMETLRCEAAERGRDPKELALVEHFFKLAKDSYFHRGDDA